MTRVSATQKATISLYRKLSCRVSLYRASLVAADSPAAPTVGRLFFLPTTGPFFSTLRRPACAVLAASVCFLLFGGGYLGVPSFLLPPPAPLGLPALR